MRRMLMLAPLSLALVACGPASTNTAGSAPAPRGDTFTCLVRELGKAGFVVQTADRDAGLIKAERATAGGFMDSATTYYLDMTLTVLDAATPGQSDVRMILSRSHQTGNGARTSSYSTVVGKDTQDANSLLGACAVTPHA